jgi:hypothetical protein
MKGILSKKTIFSIFVFLAFPFFSSAQTLDLRSSPAQPAVGDTVSVSVSSFDLNINQSEVSWYKDGKFERKGVGMKSFSFSVSEKGNTVRSVVKSGGVNLESFVRINPSSMDVLWEVVGGYEPPFYKGKIIPIKGSRIKVVAVPQIKNEKGFVPDQGTFVYGWRKDGSNFAGQSGYGLNSFLYSPGVLDRQNTIEVTASGLSRSLAKSVTIVPANSQIHFYEYDLAYGPLYNKAIKDNQTFNKPKINILAEPYFIFTKNINDPSLVTEWKVNNKIVSPASPNLILVNAEEGVRSAGIEFKSDNKTQLLQQTVRRLRLNFSNNE